jgi:hypothetical protein
MNNMNNFAQNNSGQNNSGQNNFGQIANVAYEGAAMYGQFEAVMMGISGTIVVLILYYVSYIVYKNTIKYNNTPINSTITAVDCTENKSSKGEITYYCNLTVTYTVNNINYSNKLIVEGTKRYNIKENISIKYNTSDPNEIMVDTIVTNKYMSYFICCCAFILCLCLYTYIYFIFRYKSIAAVTGAVSLADTIVD